MSTDGLTPIQCCINRLNAAGDEATRRRAQEALIAACQERVRGIVRHMLATYSRLVRWVGSDDVLNESLLRLSQALAAVPVTNTRGLLALAAQHIRWAILDLIRQYFGPQGEGDNLVSPAGPGPGGAPEPAGPVQDDPAQLAAWAELHRRISGLPAELLEVFDLHHYHQMTHAEVAALLGISERTARRRWVEAKAALAELLLP